MIPLTSTLAAAGRRPLLRKIATLALLLAGVGASQQVLAQAGTITDDGVALTVKPSGQSAQPAKNYTGSDNNGNYTNPTPLGVSDDNAVAVPQLGTYDLNGSASSSLVISDASLQGSLASSSTNVSATRLQYRVYLTGTADNMKPSYTNFTLTTSQTGMNAGSIFTGAGSPNVNVLTGLTSGGTYVLDIRFLADLTRNSTLKTIADPSTGGYFYANFYIIPPTTTPPGGTTTWQSTTANGGTSDWTTASNWSNGVPTRFSNAIIPPSATGSGIIYPVLNSPTTLYEVNNITLQGNSNSSAAQLTINTATLRVYGDIRQPAAGLKGNTTGVNGAANSTNNSTLILAGADQVITGNLLVSDIIVSGSGTKSVINQLTPTNILVFQPTNATTGVIIQSAAQDINNGTVSTVFDTTGNSYIQLVSSSTISTVAGQNETNVSYVKGVTRADRQVIAATPNTFGNIGLDITANHTPGNIVVYRVVGDALNGPVGNSTAKPIKRQYQIVGDDNSGNTGFTGSRLDVVFHYLDSTDELNGIMESNLTMFRTVNNGGGYQPLYSTLDAANNTATRLSINSLPNFSLTLGDRTNPLPVTLVAFAATRVGANAQLNWTTATEENNRGFNVQVSSNGTEFRTLDFVASKLVNSSKALNYAYTDTKTSTGGVRYYRLEQVDQDGKTSYSPVRAVSFEGSAPKTAELVAYPNPFTDAVTLTIDGATATESSTAQVLLTDLTGRTILNQQVTLTGTSLALGNLDGLRGGIYLAKVTMADGTTKTVRIRKQ